MVLLKKNNEKISHDKNENEREEAPNKNVLETVGNYLNEGSKEASGFKGKEEAEDRQSHVQSNEVRLDYMVLSKEKEKSSRSESVPLERASLLVHHWLQLKSHPNVHAKQHYIEELGFGAQQLGERHSLARVAE